MTQPGDETSPEDASRPSKAPLVQTVIGWALVLIAGMFTLITLFTFPFVLAEEGTSAIGEALAFFIPEVVVLVVGFWLMYRGKRPQERVRPSGDVNASHRNV